MSSRWQRLSLFVPTNCLTRLMDSEMPLLTNLTIGSSTPPFTTDISSKAPRLTSISFQGVYQDPRSWQIPSFNLTELRSRFCLDVQDILKLFGSAPLLESVTVRVGTMTIPPSPKYMTRLPKLVSLTLQSGSDDCSRLFTHLDVPALKHLEISAHRAPFTTEFLMASALIDCVVRCRSPLRKVAFKLKGFAVLEEDLKEMIQKIPTLVQIFTGASGLDQGPPAIVELLAERRSGQKFENWDGDLGLVTLTEIQDPPLHAL
ncbi:hypothetical protein C8J56DRAFT_950945 [Mycena floridula]|nr:hypothetical protein C8J56DRAFT_950945 [Mycena floridula]